LNIGNGLDGSWRQWTTRLRASLWPSHASEEESPLRASLFSADQMEQHGKVLAGSHRLAAGRAPDQLLARLAANESVLVGVSQLLTAAVAKRRRITPAGEWLLDNFYLIEEQIRTARKHLPKGYSLELPRLAQGPSAGRPRVYDIALDIVAHGDGHVDAECLGRFVTAYQTVTALDLGELWAIPIMLRLAVIENLVVNKEQRVPDIAYFPAGPAPSWNEGALVVHGQEYHTSLWGHTGILGPRDYFLMPAYAAYVNTAAASPFPNNPAVFDLAHAQRALTGYVHPFDTLPDPGKMQEPLTHDLPVAAALGKIDYFEVVGFSDHLVTSEVWYRLLNCGFRLPAGAGTDAMANYASLRGPVGVDRVYVKTGARPDHAAWLRGLRAGRTFATNGPLLEFSLGGKGIGDELRLPPGSHTVQARATLRSIVPIDSLQIIGNGRVVADLHLSGERTTATITHSIPITASGWYVLRAFAANPAHPILDIYPFGTTSPIYVTVGDGKVHSRDDAAYFLAWIDRLEKSAREHKGWNTAVEKEAVLSDFARAREVYLEQVSR